MHRLGIQAFEPVLTEGRALKLHPLACTAYNADFDGDQMAIHLPLSSEAQAEARVLMLAANHILAPKDGKPIIVPTQDMVLGTYYLTKIRPGAKGSGGYYTGLAEAIMAYERQYLDLQAEIFVRISEKPLPIPAQSLIVKTSLGRMIFNEQLPVELRHYQYADGQFEMGTVMNKKELGQLVARCYQRFGAWQTAGVIDSVKRLGYHYACLAGMTVASSDCIVPPQKQTILAQTSLRVQQVERQFLRGLITERERYGAVISAWNRATSLVADAMMANMDPFNPIFMMADSGARGNKQQMRQLAGMRGLMADPSGKIIDLPITANFREGLSVADYFISSHGARKGLADTALRTADSGYLTRRLVDVAQDVIVRELDCDIQSVNLLTVRAMLCDDPVDSLEILNDFLLGRVLAHDILINGQIVLPADTVLDSNSLIHIAQSGTTKFFLRARGGVEPILLGHGSMAHFLSQFSGKSLVGYISRGRRFTANQILSHDSLVDFLSREDVSALHIRMGALRGIFVQAISEGSTIIEPLQERIFGRVLAQDVFDPSGNLIAPVNSIVDADMAQQIASCHQGVLLRSVLTCRTHNGVCQKCYGVDLSNLEPVEIGEAVGIIAAQSIGEPGTQLTMRTFHTGGVAGGDITQGLPRVEELFEARKPKNSAIISDLSGTVTRGEPDKNNLRTIIITNAHRSREFTIPFGALLQVHENDYITAGTPLTDGPKNPHDILRICGLQETYRYLVKEVQKVYKSQGVEINDKHIEVMVRQMLHKVRAGGVHGGFPGDDRNGDLHH